MKLIKEDNITMTNIRIPTFIFAFLLMGILVPLLTPQTASGVGPIAQCCTTEPDGGQCVGCPEGATCTSTVDFCERESGFLGRGISCFNEPTGAECGFAVEREGCCVLESGSCLDLEASDGCFLREGSPGEIYVSDLSCSQVPQCTITKNIPTLSNWGLIALAAVFVLVGVWAITRKKAEA